MDGFLIVHAVHLTCLIGGDLDLALCFKKSELFIVQTFFWRKVFWNSSLGSSLHQLFLQVWTLPAVAMKFSSQPQKGLKFFRKLVLRQILNFLFLVVFCSHLILSFMDRCHKVCFLSSPNFIVFLFMCSERLTKPLKQGYKRKYELYIWNKVLNCKGKIEKSKI